MDTIDCGVRVVGLALVRYGDRAMAIQDSEDKVWFGPVGITPGERALVNIYAIGNPDDVGDPNVTPWNFVVHVQPARRARPGAEAAACARVIGSVEVAVEDEENMILTPLSRRTFRAEIVGFNPQPDPPGKWAVTLEVVDRLTGRTRLVIGNPDVLPAESLAPPGAAQ